MKHTFTFLLFLLAANLLKSQGFNASNIQQPTCFGACDGSVTFTTSANQGPYTAVVTNSASCPNSTLSSSSASAITLMSVCACSSPYTVTIYTGTIIAGVNYVQFPNYASAPLTVSVPSVSAASCSGCCTGSAYISWSGGNTGFSNNPPAFTIDGMAITSYSPAANLCAGSHTVCAIDSSNCVACKVFSVSYNVSTGIKQQSFANTHINLYPNPVSTDLTVETGKGGAIEKAYIFDLLGRKVFEYSFDITPQEKIEVNVSSLPQGLYFVEVYGTSGRSVHRARFTKKDN
jgi:hypothetical protein